MSSTYSTVNGKYRAGMKVKVMKHEYEDRLKENGDPHKLIKFPYHKGKGTLIKNLGPGKDEDGQHWEMQFSDGSKEWHWFYYEDQ